MKTSPRQLKRLREEMKALQDDPSDPREGLRRALESFFRDPMRVTEGEKAALTALLVSG